MSWPMFRSARLGAIVAAAIFVAAQGASAQEDKTKTIAFQYTERHDRLTPELNRDIQWTNFWTVKLSGKNTISETLSTRYEGSSGYPATEQRAAALARNESRDAVLGDESKKYVWKVVGPSKLRRVWTGTQFAIVIDVELEPHDKCHIKVRYLKQVGFVDVIMKQAGTNTMQHFTLPHVIGSSCEIRSS